MLSPLLKAQTTQMLKRKKRKNKFDIFDKLPRKIDAFELSLDKESWKNYNTLEKFNIVGDYSYRAKIAKIHLELDMLLNNSDIKGLLRNIIRKGKKYYRRFLIF